MGFIVATSVALGFQVNAPKKMKKSPSVHYEMLVLSGVEFELAEYMRKKCPSIKTFCTKFFPETNLKEWTVQKRNLIQFKSHFKKDRNCDGMVTHEKHRLQLNRKESQKETFFTVVLLENI